MSEATAKNPAMPYFYGYNLVAYALITQVIASAFFYQSRGIFMPIWMDEFNVSNTQMSLVITLILFSVSLFAPLVGYVIDRFSLRKVIPLFALWLAIGFALLQQFAHSYLAFLIIFVLFYGPGSTGTGTLAHTKLVVNWFSKNRGKAMAIAVMGSVVSGVFMPTVVTYLGESVGWRTSYLLFAAVLVLFIVPATILVVRDKPQDMGLHPDGIVPDESDLDHDQNAPAEEVKEEFGLAAYKEIIRSSTYWNVIAIYLLIGAMLSSLLTHLPTYMTKELSYTLYEASYLLGFVGLVMMVSKLFWGAVIDKVRAKFTLLGTLSFGFAGSVILIYASNYWLIGAAIALLAFSGAGIILLRSVLISRIFGPAKFSRANGLAFFLLAPAPAMIFLTGYVADSVGGYASAFQIWAGIFLLAAVITMLARLPDKDQDTA